MNYQFTLSIIVSQFNMNADGIRPVVRQWFAPAHFMFAEN